MCSLLLAVESSAANEKGGRLEEVTEAATVRVVLTPEIFPIADTFEPNVHLRTFVVIFESNEMVSRSVLVWLSQT